MHEDARNPPQHNFVKGEVYSLIFCQMRSSLGALSCFLLLFTKLFDTVTVANSCFTRFSLLVSRFTSRHDVIRARALYSAGSGRDLEQTRCRDKCENLFVFTLPFILSTLLEFAIIYILLIEATRKVLFYVLTSFHGFTKVYWSQYRMTFRFTHRASCSGTRLKTLT